MIRQDPLSKLLSVVALTGLIILSTTPIWPAALIAGFIILAALVLDRYTRHEEEASLAGDAKSQIFAWAVVALVIFIIMGRYIAALPALAGIGVALFALSFFQARLYGMLIAISEEQFFRGFLMNYLMSYRKAKSLSVAALMNGAIFTVYHYAVYGTSPGDLVFVFGAGVTLAVIDWKAQRVSPSLIAHVINNLMVA